MRRFTTEQLAEILLKHRQWLNGETGGSRADLTDAVLTGAVLTGAVLTGADLTGAVLARAVLTGADLARAVLTDAVLTGADLTDAVDLPAIDPMPDIRAKLLAAVERDGCRIEMQHWHTCDTVHCLAGWTTTIHPQGKLLESIMGPSSAAALILNASGEKIPNFFDTGEGGNERAMNWLRTGQQVDTKDLTAK